MLKTTIIQIVAVVMVSVVVAVVVVTEVESDEAVTFFVDNHDSNNACVVSFTYVIEYSIRREVRKFRSAKYEPSLIAYCPFSI